MRSLYFITPTLVLGSGTPEIEVTPAESARDALVLISEGRTALIPDGRWDMATEILRELGCDDEWIAGLFHFAKTGQLLPQV